MNEQGFIVLHRKLLEWKYRQYPYALALWVYLIMRANWKPAWFLGVEIPRGSLAASMKSLADETGMTPVTVRKWLKVFEADGMITRKATNRFTIINISKYKDFQDIPEDRVLQQSLQQPLEQSLQQPLEQSLQQPLHNRTNKQSNKETNIKEREKRESTSSRFVPPSLDEIILFCEEKEIGVDPETFVNYYESNGWMVGNHKMKDWKAALRTWEKRDKKQKQDHQVVPLPKHFQGAPKKKIDYSTLPGLNDDNEKNE